jgi:hypothetical protein
MLLTSTRVTIIAVNIEVAIPIMSVIEKPLIGPVPTANRIMPAIKVVMFASKIVEKALSYPK